MERITESMLRNRFVTFCDKYNLKVAKDSLDHNGYGLEKSYSSNWIIYRIADDYTGHCHPFGNSYRSTREMFECLSFAIDLKYSILMKIILDK